MKLSTSLSRKSPSVLKQCLPSSLKNSSKSAQLGLRNFNTSFHSVSSISKTHIGRFQQSFRGLDVQTRSFASDAEIKIKVPTMGDSITEGTIQTLHKKVGDSVKTDDIVITIETDKVTSEVRAPENGTITAIVVNPQDVVKIGADLFSMKPGAAPAAASASKPQSKPSDSKPAESKSSESNQQQPQKQEEKSQKTESTQATQQPKETQQPNQQPPQQSAPQQSSSSSTFKTLESTLQTPQTPSKRGETRVKMPRIRDRIATRLKEAQNTYAMLTTFQDCDMSALMTLRDTYKEEFFEKHNGVKLGFMSAFVKASAIALKEQPAVNGVIDGKEIVYRDYIDISVAVATPTGLVVPVIRNADQLSFAGVEKTIADYGKKARNGQIQIEDMAGGTFTISNGGVYGSLMGTPIINPPQSAILGMHAINKRPVVVNDQIVIRPMMYLALTYDHRLIDGREAVTFLRKIKSTIEDPRRLLLDL